MTLIDPQPDAPKPEAVSKPVTRLSVVPRAAPAGDGAAPVDSRQSIWRPIVAGVAIIAVFVVGLTVWAAFSAVSGGVVAHGSVRVAGNVKTLRKKEGGIVDGIYVTEGQKVAAGQPLIHFRDLEVRAQYDVLADQYLTLLMQKAGWEAERNNASRVALPPELSGRAGEPKVQALLREQQKALDARVGVTVAQKQALNQREKEMVARIDGLKAQMSAVEAQSGLINDELGGVQRLYNKGYAPRTRLLQLQRNAADLTGSRGARVSDISSVQESIGETRIQNAQVDDQVQSRAQQNLQQLQGDLFTVIPKLAAAKQVLDETLIRAPVAGYVLDLSQYTVGGVAGPGEKLMDIVPLDAPLVIEAKVLPKDITQVHMGQAVQVRLTAFNPRLTPTLNAKVETVSADKLTDPKLGDYFRVTLTVPTEELKRLPKGERVTPGMPADLLMVTGDRSILSYLLGPLRDSFNLSMHER